MTERDASPCLSLVFAPGQRPDRAAIAALAAAQIGAGNLAIGDVAFSISHDAAEEGWLELLTNGLTFDCRGIAPAPPEPLPAAGTPIGMTANPGGETLVLTPGPHLRHSAGLLPILRVLVGLGARLAELPGVLAVVWSPAGSWVEPATFVRTVRAWLGGGVFPALVLTGLEQQANGAMVTRGLDLLAGQELRFEPDRRVSPAAMARIAVRLVHQVVLAGPIETEMDLVGPAGEALLAVPVRQGSEVRVLVRATGPGG